eukprot:CAMPEP_0201890678 /NCGR_PEP_ID=MMETSP0902-20130614/32735_1 /ASSEMBLY_ACC=CAM_ASM_000551 /TAXON_ID=420261 /ORGANISM="Thalassiosira antarctica, Strain CCMP982" /LENGTH=627 /DNA_ID=CAMNT_0048421605 /DNA_START=407 /DNA_END=2290 /DNA_ORIENTATION=-
MEPNQPKRPRKEEPNKTRYRGMSSSSEELQERSLYERKIGKIISTCSNCLGEGNYRKLSKKARAHRKRMRQNNNSENSGERDITSNDTASQQPPMLKPCPVCDGSGLIAIPPSESNNEREQTKNSEAPQVHVAIVGGGIGGIALAVALQQRRIPCVVYERDMSFEERKQGYGLTMQQGARALMSLGFFSFSDNDKNDNDSSTNNQEGSDYATECDKKSKPQLGIHSTKHVVHKPDGTIVGEWGMKVWGGRFEKNGRKHAKRQNAHISRQNLRKLLMDMLLPGTIKWGYKFIGYSDRSCKSEDGNANSNLKLTFQRRISECQGTEEECEEEFTTNATIIVGCDGIRSAVRAKKLGNDVAPLRYLGCIVILGIATSPDSALTDGETVFQTADGVTRLYAMPFAPPGEEPSAIDGSDFHQDTSDRGLSMWQLSFPMEERDAKHLSQLGPSALKAEALKRCSQWHDPIPQLLSQTSEDLITGYPCYDRALVDRAVFREGCNAPGIVTGNPFVTMLGDAAHPMSPFKGQGANQALLDAVILARKLYNLLRIDKKKPDDESTKHLSDRIPLALNEFEDEMLQRSDVKVKKSADAAKFLHTHVAISEGNVTRGAAAVEDAAKVKEVKHDLIDRE